MISFIYKCFIGFFLRILINDLTESSTNLKFLEKVIFTNYSSFQFDLRLENFLILIFLTILSIFLIFFENFKLIKALVLKTLSFEFILFSFLKGLNNNIYNIFFNKNLIIIFILNLFYLVIFKFFFKNCDKQKEVIKEIYEARKLDFKKLNRFLEEASIIGIDSEWGQGKSYFVNYWKNKQKVTAIVISILNKIGRASCRERVCQYV